MADLFPALFDQGGELVTNGTFDSDYNGWTPTSSGVYSVVSGRLRVEHDGTSGGFVTASFPTEVGKRYRFSVDCWVEGTGARYLVRLGTSSGGSQYLNAFFETDGSRSHEFTATGTALWVRLANGSGTGTFAGQYTEFDNASLAATPFFPATVSGSGIAPSLLTNTQTFYAPTVAPALAQPLLTNSQSYYAPTITVTVHPGLYSNTSSFYDATLGGPEILRPQLVARTFLFDTDVFDSALFDTGEEILEPTVTAGAVTLSPSLFTNEQTFFAGEVPPPQELTPELLLNNPLIYLPGVWGAPVVGGPSWAEDAPDDASWSAVTPGSASWATGNTGSSLWTPVIPGEGSWA